MDSFDDCVTQKIITIFYIKGKHLRMLINLWVSFFALIPSDVFILVLIGQLGICLFLMFADIEDLYSKMDVSIVQKGIFFLLPVHYKHTGIVLTKGTDFCREIWHLLKQIIFKEVDFR